MIKVIVALLSGLIFVASEAAAQPCPTGGLTTLTNGTNADATQVMGNFTYIANCVNNYAPPSVPPGSITAYAGFSLPTGWLWANGQAVARATYPALLAALSVKSTVTITIASPGIVTWTAHGLTNGWPVQFSTTGALPTGLVAGTTYYVISATTNTFQVAAAPAGTAINTSGSQSGTQTAIFAPYGNGDGATTFNVPDLRGRVAFGLDNLGGATAANNLPANGTYIKGTSPGAAGGEHAHALTASENGPHSHTSGSPTAFATFNSGAGYYTNAGSGGVALYYTFTTEPSGSGTPHNAVPPALMTNYIVKY